MPDYTLEINNQKAIDQDNVLLLPANNEKDAALFLESLQENNINFLGSGYSMWNLGISIPQIRKGYIHLNNQLANRLKSRMGKGIYSDHNLAKWVVNERTKIARHMRLRGMSRQGLSSFAIYKARDTLKYGQGGKTYSNMVKYALKTQPKVYTVAQADQYLLKSATRPNTKISSASFKVGKYLKNGGRVAVVVGVALSTHTILTAEEYRLEEVISREAGSFAGGALATSATVGVCMIFGILTGGWGLLAVGIIAGTGGGILGGYLGEKTYHYVGPNVITGTAKNGVIRARELVRPNWDAPSMRCMPAH
ncbi:MAG: hypothetical protein GY705_00910 [Bacteroidetes bacterium]|nr:hypothetical protein [Bacteroidota bacterium]